MSGWRSKDGSERMVRLLASAAVAALLAGCSGGNMRLAGTPLFAASNPQASALAPIESADLPPAGLTPGAPMNTTASLKAQGYTLESAPIVEVGGGDTAATLSQGFGVPVPVILEANGLVRPDEITPGKRLVIPRRALPPATSFAAGSGPVGLGAPAVPLDAQAREGRHVVQPGDTLFSIAASHRVSQESVRNLNGLPADGTVKVGQTLRIPEAAGANIASSLAPAPATPAANVEVAAIEPTTVTDAVPERIEAPGALPKTAETPKPAEPVAAAPAAPDASQAPSNFRWPVQGRIIAGFGKQADGGRNDGINLAVPAGTPVRAAEKGTVIYAGNELEGYGNLVLVQHADGWVSAYAHNETINVSRGDQVTRGQPIAAVGKSGAVDQPQLHFELRKKSKPVDPLPHLAGA